MTVHVGMSVRECIDRHPETIAVFQSFGLTELANPVVQEKLGPFLKLRTLLAHRAVDPEAFVERCREASDAERAVGGADPLDVSKAKPTLLALLPCGLRFSVDRALSALADDLGQRGAPFEYLAEGNVNHELSYYPYVESVTSLDELPDVILSADLNAFFHRRFLERFADRFVDVGGPVSPRMAEIGFADPGGRFTMLCANPLVLVHVKDATRALPAPSSWGDLLAPDYRGSIVMRGQGSFFCSGVLVPFLRLFGMDAIPRLAANVREGVHPSQMVKMIDGKSPDVAPFFIMPWFFARKIKATHRVDILFPKEGALVSPVQILVKASARARLAELTDFLAGESLHRQCADNFFPPTHPDAPDIVPKDQKLFWIGWDFIEAHDLQATKREVGEVFTRAHLASSASGGPR